MCMNMNVCVCACVLLCISILCFYIVSVTSASVLMNASVFMLVLACVTMHASLCACHYDKRLRV